MLSAKNDVSGFEFRSRIATRTIHTRMTPAQWIAVPDNPRQRDTARHLAQAKHLLLPSPTHCHVAMAICSDGSRFKLDGHTRAKLWIDRPELAPEVVHVTIYYVSDALEAADLYTHFDAREALETPADKVSGAYHEIGWFPQSSFLLGGSITSALRSAEAFCRGTHGEGHETRQIPIYWLIPAWKAELQAFDGISPVIKNRRWNQATIIAFLLTDRRRPEKAPIFWDLFNRDVGVKLENEMDGVEAANRLIRQGSSALNRRLTLWFAGRFVSAFESWRSGHTYKSSSAPKETNLVEYTKPLRKEGGLNR